MSCRVPRVCLCFLLAVGFGCHRTKTRVSEVKAAGGANQDRILRGFYPGAGEWLWTAPEFALRLDPANDALPSYLELEFTVPDKLIAAAPTLTLTAKVNGTEVVRKSYNKAGRNVLSVEVPRWPISCRNIYFLSGCPSA